MAIDFGTEVEKLSPQQLEAEISEVDAPNSPVWSKAVYDTQRDLYLDRREKLYNARMKAKGEADISQEDIGLHTRLKQAGLQSSEQIEKESLEGRQEIVDQKIDQHLRFAETALKNEWGSSYEDRLDKANMIFENFLDEMDQDWIRFTPEGGRALGNDPEFIKIVSRLGEMLLSHNDRHKVTLENFTRTWKSKKK